MKRLLAALTGVVLLAVPAAATAAVDITSVSTDGYPRTQATVVTGKPTRLAPELTEKGTPAAGVLAENLGDQRSICLAVDRSRSMRGKPLEEAVGAAQAFIAAKLSTDRLCVTSFATSPLLLSPFSESGADAVAALKGIRVDKTVGTTLWDDVVLSANTLAEEQRPARIIVMVTDGNETRSHASLAEAVTAAKQAHASVYVVAIESRAFRPGPLRFLASRTGGRYFGAPSPDKLAGIYKDLANELKRTWRMEYITTARPGETRTLVARVPGQGRASEEFTVAETAKLPGGGGLLPAAAYGRGGVAGLGLLIGLLALLGYALVVSSTNADRLRMKVQRHVAPKKPLREKKEKKPRLQAFAGLFSMTDNAFGRTRLWERLRRLIERADLPLKPVELFYMMVGSSIGIGLLLTMVGASGLIALGGLIGGALLPAGIVWFKGQRRLQAFENQLPDLLIGMAASLKAGHSFKQGLQAIVDEGIDPAGKEFNRVLTESRLGRPIEDALDDMATRVGSANLSFIITAIGIQQQVGGSLASLFDMVSDTVRNRQQFARKIKALTAMGRMSAYVLIGLPFFLAGALTLMNPSYMAPLYQTSAGHKMIITSIVMMFVGSLFLKRIVSFKG